MNLIPNIRKIVSLDIPELQPYRTLRRPMNHIRDGIFVAEGEKVVQRLLASPLQVISMLITHKWLAKFFPEKDPNNHYYSTRQSLPTIYIAEKSLLETIVGFNLHQGIMAVAKVPNELSLKETIEKIPAPHLLVALEGLGSAENVGVIVRNCAAFGVDAIIVGETSSSPYLRRAVRNSMGTVFTLPVIHSSNLVESLSTLRNDYNTKIIAAHPHESSSIHTSVFTGKVCIVFGNEGEGISKKILDLCDELVAIPMMNQTDSLNVSTASAVFLYEARKQRENLTKDFLQQG